MPVFRGPRARLVRFAQRTARRRGDAHVASVDVVETSGSGAGRIFGPGQPPGRVYVLAIRGRFGCRTCSRRSAMFELDPRTLHVLRTVVRRVEPDLRELGRVYTFPLR
jgi:hypothetical protein